jgi:hypothetical protein
MSFINYKAREINVKPVAHRGEGVFETLKGIARLIVDELKKGDSVFL